MTAQLRPPETDAAPDDRPEAADERSAPTGTTKERTTVDDVSPNVATDELLELLGDEYACEILRALEDGPMPARAIIDQRDMSRPTVYRRLDRLTDAGIVATRMRPDPDGHHRQEFRLVVDEIEFQLGSDGIDADVRAENPAAD